MHDGLRATIFSSLATQQMHETLEQEGRLPYEDKSTAVPLFVRKANFVEMGSQLDAALPALEVGIGEGS